MNKKTSNSLCPCGSNKKYSECCARYVDNSEPAPTAEALMRSRYTAYTQLAEDYLLATWHPSTRPAALGLAEDVPTKWLGLEVKRHEQQDADHAGVAFGPPHKVERRAAPP